MTKIYIILTLLILLFSLSCTDRIVYEEVSNQEDMELTISPPAGTYHTDQTVTITNRVPESIIRYTTDGSNPTDTSYVNANSLLVAANKQLKVRAFKAGWYPSEIKTANYVMEVAPLVITPDGGSYHNDQEVTITCATPNVTIRYTTDGSNPTDTSEFYTEPLIIDGNTTLKAQSFREGWTSSEMLTHSYFFRVADPVITPERGSYDEAQEVRITCTTDGAIIRYTTDGEEPTGSSPQYTIPLNIDGNTTLKVQAFREGWTPSEMVREYYEFIVSTPDFNPPGGSYQTAQDVTITCETEGAVIRYTTDGNEPTLSSPQYSVPVNVHLNATLKAKAFKERWTDSETISARYFDHIEGMVLVEGGTFNPSANYTVTLSSFYLSKDEITQSEWTSVMDGIYNPNWTDYGQGHNHPAYYISWFDAIEYCNRLSIRESLTPAYSYGTSGTNPSNWPAGWNTDRDNHTNVSCNWNATGYRLPTEMEWEFAARGGVPAQNAGTFNTTYSGSNNIDDVAWYGSNSGSRTHDVGTKAPNELGLYDMSGNVWEWNWDIYGSYPTGSHNDPKGANSGSDRLLRGGSWNNDVDYCRVGYRLNRSATDRYNNVGLRVSRSVK